MVGHYLIGALRRLRSSPTATLANILALTLGLTCFIASYAVVRYWQQSERHFSNANRTYVLTMDLNLRDGPVLNGMTSTSAQPGRYLRTDYPELEAVARAQGFGEIGALADERKVSLYVAGVDPEFLRIFSLPFTAGDAQNALRQPDGVVITRDAAQKLFGTQAAMGRSILMNGTVRAAVTGVIDAIPEPSHMGQSASAMLRFDVLVSWEKLRELGAVLPRADANEAGEEWVSKLNCLTYVLLPSSGALTAATFNDQLKDFAARHVPAQLIALTNLQFGALPVSKLTVQRLNQTLFSGSAGVSVTALLLLLGGIVLAVACLNYANLAVAQAAGRAKEIGMRKVLGAHRMQVARQCVLEAALLATVALVLSLVTVELIVPVVKSFTGMDLRVSLFADAGFWFFLAGLVAMVSVIAGAYPGLVLSRVRPVTALRTGRVRSGPRFVATLLVGVQFAAASFLLVALIVVYAQNNELRRAGLGKTRDALVVITNKVGTPRPDLTTLRAELNGQPQIKAVTAINLPPWSFGGEILALSRSRQEGSSEHSMMTNHVGLDFIDALDMKLLAGRSFRRQHGEDTMPVSLQDWDPQRTANVVIDHALALQLGFASPREAVDKIVYIPARIMRTIGKPAIGVRVVGVVENMPLRVVAFGGNNSNLYTLTDADMYPVIRIAGNGIPAGLAAITDRWDRLSPSAPLKLRFMDDLFEESYEIFGRVNQVFAGLSVFAFIIAVIGLVAMALYVTGRRTHEIGVRKTLGATVGGILWMLLRDFSVPVVIGNLVAWPLAFITMQKYLSTFTHRIELTFLPFALSLVVTVLIAWLAVSGHAIRAARVKPAAVLRYE